MIKTIASWGLGAAAVAAALVASCIAIGGGTKEVIVGDNPNNKPFSEKFGKGAAEAVGSTIKGAASTITSESVENAAEVATDATIRGASAAAAGVKRGFQKNFPDVGKSINDLLGVSSKAFEPPKFNPPPQAASAATVPQVSAAPKGVAIWTPDQARANVQDLCAKIRNNPAEKANYPTTAPTCEP